MWASNNCRRRVGKRTDSRLARPRCLEIPHSAVLTLDGRGDRSGLAHPGACVVSILVAVVGVTAHQQAGIGAAGELSSSAAGRPGPAGQTHLEPVPATHRRAGGRARRVRSDRGDLDRPGGPDRGRAGHVQLRDAGRGDPPARPDAAGGAAAEDHHAGRRGDRPGHRVQLVPQRPAARVGAGAGPADRSRRATHGEPATAPASCSTASRTPTAASATRSGCGSNWSRSSRSSGCGTSGSTTWPSWPPTVGADRRRPANGTASRWTSSTA